MNQHHFFTVINGWVSRQTKPPFSLLKTTKRLHFKCTQQTNNQFPPFSSIIKNIKHHTTLSKLHAQFIVTGVIENNTFISNSLMIKCISFGFINDAHKIFNQILNKNIFSWTILISGFSRYNLYDDALSLFKGMVKNGFLPNEVTFSSILPAIGNLGLTQIGKSMHCYWVRRGFGSNAVVNTCFVDMYASFGCLSIARYMFDEMPVRNVVSWNVIISGYASNGMGCDAIMMFNLMRMNGVCSDWFTFMSLISASSGVNWGRGSSVVVHGLIIKSGYINKQEIGASLIDMYTSGNCIDEAYSVFVEMPVKDVVVWTLMLESFVSGQCWSRAIDHCNEMMSIHCMDLDSTAIVSILTSCTCSGAFDQGCRVHALVVKRGFSNDVFVGSALIDMYSQFGELNYAKKHFSEMEAKDVTCWNAMIAAMGANGDGDNAVDLLMKMEILGINPNESTLVSVLSACSHAGKADEGVQIFSDMVKRWGVIPNLQHYACIVDLLSRVGKLDEANSVVDKMSTQPHSGVYGALLSACRVYGNAKIGSEIFQKLLKLDLIDDGHFLSASNMYASIGCTEMSQTILKKKGLKNDPGFSLIR